MDQMVWACFGTMDTTNHHFVVLITLLLIYLLRYRFKILKNSSLIDLFQSNKTDNDKKIYLDAYEKCLENENTNPEVLYEKARSRLEEISFIPWGRRNIIGIAITIVIVVTISLLIFMFWCFLAKV